MSPRNRAAVVVLGDIWRSPRMQCHALSLARQSFLEVDIVAYGGTVAFDYCFYYSEFQWVTNILVGARFVWLENKKFSSLGSAPHTSLLENKSVHIHKMPQWPTVPQTFPKIIRPLILILKPIIQFLMLLWYLCIKIPAPDAFIVQNPPSVPTLVVVKWASWFRHSAFIVDWHNFGYTLLALSLGRSSYFVAVYRWIEKHFGKMAHGSLCVTRAMQHGLAQNRGIKATVLYDKPPEFFRPALLEEKHDTCTYMAGSAGADRNYLNTTPFTTQIDRDISLKENRPALIVSSTSWTPDEDFSILLEAAVMYDRRVAALLHEDNSIRDETVWEEIHSGKRFAYPRLLFIITGKGPEKEKYEKKLKKLSLKRVAFCTMWLSAEDYALLLGSADLGVCLHTSSSGLDLPMKVVDMFGCGLPVCAVSYSCIKELVETGKNGLLFSSSSELADELMMLFEGFPDRCDALQSMRMSLMERISSSRWATEWEENAKPLIHRVISENSSGASIRMG